METVVSTYPFETDIVELKNGNEIEIGFIKHASLMLNYEGKYIYIDPLTEYCNFELMPKADVILITHSHYDHFDIRAIELLEKEGSVIVLNQETFNQLKRGNIIRNAERFAVSDWLDIEAVAAYNTTEGRDKFHPKGRDNGYVITVGGSRIYISGDTEPTPEMLGVKEVDILFLPIDQPYTMTKSQAIDTVKALNPKIFYPFHYADTNVRPFVEALQGVDVRIRQMQ